MDHLFWIIFLFLAGISVGSFMNVLIHRLPRGESIVFPGSHCPECGRAIHWYDNLPIASYLLLRGRCRFCKVRISPRYLYIELATGVMVAALYVIYFVLELRAAPTPPGDFADAWPMFAAHAVLLCGLLTVSMVDIQEWIILPEVMWFVALVGVGAAAWRPHPWLAPVGAELAGASIAALAGLALAMLLQRVGILQPSFIDAQDEPLAQPEPRNPQAGGNRGDKAQAPKIAFEKSSTLSPRREVLRELLFLTPAIALAMAAWLIIARTSAGNWWQGFFDVSVHPVLAPRLSAASAAVFGYLIGGAWIWGARIFGTLGFGKEAMGLGDVHLLAGVGAVTGWIVPSVAFFLAPLFGLAWAMYLLLRRNQRELPYGPWLAAASAAVMIFYDLFAELLGGYADSLDLLLGS